MYSLDFRRKVLRVKEKEGLTVRETGKRFDVGAATVMRWLKRIEGKAGKTRRRKLDKEKLLEDVKQYPEAYLYERAKRFGVNVRAIWQMLRKLGVTYKKKSTPSESRPASPRGFSGKTPSASSGRQGDYFCR